MLITVQMSNIASIKTSKKQEFVDFGYFEIILLDMICDNILEEDRHKRKAPNHLNK